MQSANEPKTLLPSLEKYAKGLQAELWKRPELSARDRSVVHSPH